MTTKMSKAELIAENTELKEKLAAAQAQIADPTKVRVFAHMALLHAVNLRLHKIARTKGNTYVKVHIPEDHEIDLLENFLKLNSVAKKERTCPDCEGSGWFDAVKAQPCFSCITGRLLGKLGVQTLVDQKGQEKYEEIEKSRTNRFNSQKPPVEEKKAEKIDNLATESEKALNNAEPSF